MKSEIQKTSSKKIKMKLPESWNDLTQLQMQRMAKLFYSGASSILFDFQVFMILNNCRWFQIGKWLKLRIILSQVPLSDMKKHYRFIYSENNRTVFPLWVEVKGKTFFAPLDRITNLTAEEFAVADDLHIKWRETKDVEFLYYLMATLYSETKQPREKFDKNNLPEKVKHFKKIPIEVMLSAEIAYFGCKNHIVKKFPEAFPAKGKKSKKKYGFGKVILEMAGGKFGNHNETKTTNIYTFLEEFNENLKQAKS